MNTDNSGTPDCQQSRSAAHSHCTVYLQAPGKGQAARKTDLVDQAVRPLSLVQPCLGLDTD